MGQPTEEGYEILEAVIKCILARWSTLNIAVEYGFGGSDSYYMRFDLEDDLLMNIKERWNAKGEKAKIFSDEIEVFLRGELEDNFNTVCDDEDPKQIGREIVSFYNECYNGELDHANQYLDKYFDTAKQQIDKLASFIGKTCVDEDNEDAEFEEDDDDAYEEVHCMSDCDSSSCASHDEEKQEEEDDGWVSVKKGKKK
ncbi:hypothetical protein WA158_007676 [Blastocystis sp. Blastoise]